MTRILPDSICHTVMGIIYQAGILGNFVRTYNSLKFDVIVKINFVLAKALEVT